MTTDTAAAVTAPVRDRGRFAALTGVFAVLLALIVASLGIGAQRIAPAEIWSAFSDYTGADAQVIVRDVRLPRTLLAICVGAALAVSGALVQTLTRNPLAEPGVLGVTEGAGFAIIIGQLAGLGAGQGGRLLLAFAGSVLAASLVYGVGRTSPLRLVLAGTALMYVLAGIALGLRLLLPDVFDRYRFWAIGSLSGREQMSFWLPLTVIAIGLIGALLVSGPLSALALGEHVAHSLGAHVVRTRVIVLAAVTLLAAAATAVAGPIVYVGLIVPHLARRFAAGSIRWLLAFTLLLGPVLLLAADTVSRILLPNGEVPVAVVTAFIGGPALMWTIRRYGGVA